MQILKPQGLIYKFYKPQWGIYKKLYKNIQACLFASKYIKIEFIEWLKMKIKGEFKKMKIKNSLV